MKGRCFKKQLVIIVFLLAFSQLIVSQNIHKVIVISDLVGTLIDSTERVKHALFLEYSDEDFQAAQFFQLSDSEKEIRIYLKNGEIASKIISDEVFTEYQKQINRKIINYNEIDTSFVYSIMLFDETVLYGRFLEIKEREVVFETNYLGLFTIPKNRVLDVEKSMSASDFQNQLWFPNPNDTRHCFAPTARSLQKGEGYFQDIYLFLGFVNYGVTNNISIGGGVSFVPFMDIEDQLLFLNPKIGFQVNDKINLGGGIFYASGPTFDDDEDDDKQRSRAGIGYGIGTYGSKENNATLGIGYGAIDGKAAKSPIVMLGGMYRISRRIALVSENWFAVIDFKKEIDDDQEYMFWNYQSQHIDYESIYEQKYNEPTAIISYGVRFFSEKICVDLAFLNILGEIGPQQLFIPGIPYLDFVIKF